jgi:hypothetical protein
VPPPPPLPGPHAPRAYAHAPHSPLHTLKHSLYRGATCGRGAGAFWRSWRVVRVGLLPLPSFFCPRYMIPTYESVVIA